MLNPNTDALSAILVDCPGFDDAPPRHIARVAEFLASRGVLVISDAVLTDEALDKAGLLEYSTEWGGLRTTEEESERMRSGLSRLAKGEAQ